MCAAYTTTKIVLGAWLIRLFLVDVDEVQTKYFAALQAYVIGTKRKSRH